MKHTSNQKLSLAALALAVCGLSQAAEVPKGSSYDSRIQYVMYNPDEVVVIKTRAGNSTLVQLQADEYLVDLPAGGLSMGDTEAWTLGVRGNNIFLKPKGPFPDTNINLVTNKRTYAISLVNVDDTKVKTAWQVRYRYPAEPVALQSAGKGSAPAVSEPCSDGPKNLNWFKYGDQSLAPTEVWDDGRFTCMRFPTSKALPAPYRYSPETELKEALPNFNWNEDVLVIHEVNEEFRLRLGTKVLGIKTDSLKPAAYNQKMTTTGEFRVKRNGQ
ncbi:Type IV secretion system protein virB9 [Pseudomonas fluorescens]|uniref:TrbG/VirB9 family P-type conjugative transfer protein n=1 Tax=Pseudomonas fluorescens TaxID=294 RepID=UPI001241189D|nr:TrbG/VirB9 family P-type conjugative transfer protein [Pseudomonas fluorescens]VVN22409.1 Type IV secretion system protein virB9 [Pseudomonas fluorescens]